jgi:hypothetical protein
MVAKRVVRKVIWILAGLVVLVVIAGVVVVLSLGSIVKAGINTVGPRVAKVPVSVQKVRISLLGGSFAMEGFQVGNPAGFKTPHSFTADRIEVNAELRSLLSDEMVIPLIEIDQPAVTLEFAGGKTNMGEIMKGLQTPAPQPEPQKQKPQKRMRIGLIKVLGAKVSVAGLPAVGSTSVSVPDIQISDVGTGGQGATPQEVASRTLSAVYEAVVGAVGSVLSAEQLDTLKGGLSDALKAGQSAIEEGGKKAKEAAGGVKKGIEGIFK